MVRPKRSFKLKRIKKYENKFDTTIIAKRFYDQMNRLVELLSYWLIIQDNSEKESFQYLQSQNIPSELWPYYIAYTKKQMVKALKFEIDTMLIELMINLDTFVKRGLSEEILKDLQQPQEKWASVWLYLLGQLKNAYADYCFADFCVCW